MYKEDVLVYILGITILLTPLIAVILHIIIGGGFT